jgi:hypothetical protein
VSRYSYIKQEAALQHVAMMMTVLEYMHARSLMSIC